MDDLISRQEAIDAICSVCGMEKDFHNCDWYSKDSKYQFCEEINALRRVPSAEPEGYWKKTVKHHKDSEQEFNYYEIRCSECDCMPEKAYHLTKYCPNCGAKMKEDFDE